MSIKVCIPTPWRNLTGGRAQVEVEAGNVAELLDKLEAFNPGFKSQVVNERGEIFRYIIIFVNREAVSPGLHITLNEGDELAFVPALAGDGTGYLVVEKDPANGQRQRLDLH